MKILGIIPARGGSKGIPGKNIKELHGKPLLQYTFESAKASQLLSRVVLSSENEGIIKTAQEIGLDVPFIRPAALSADHSSSLEVVQHTLRSLEQQGQRYDGVCLLQVTSPFRRKGLIDECIEKFRSRQYDCLLTVREVPAEFNPHWVFEEREGFLKITTGEEDLFTRRQELPKAYHRDGSVYLTRTEVIMEQNSLYGRNIGFIDTTGDLYVNLDTPEDWKEAERLTPEYNATWTPSGEPQK